MNIKTIAKMAGVSVATVSKIINNYSDVGEDTRKRVLKIMEETGYRPSSSAKTLATKKSSLIGVVYAGKINSNLNHPFFADVLNAFKKQIGLFGYDLLLFSNEKFFESKEDYLARCLHFNVDGCMVIAGDEIESSIAKLDQSSIPCVGVDIELSGHTSAFIMYDNAKISSRVIEHFYINGYRDIGFMGIKRSSRIISIREEAFLASLKNFGMDHRPEWFVYSDDYGEENGYQAMKTLIARGSLPKAMFCSTDMLAFGALRAIKEAGLSVPLDIAIVGCDDLEICQYASPALTTVRQDREKIGKMSAFILYDLMNKQLKQTSFILDPEFVIRESCGNRQ